MTELELQDDAGVPSGLWERMRADPQFAPEHLAVEAVRRIGPQATAWVNYVRSVQPQVSNEELAQIAAKKFTNIAGITGAVSGAAGLPGAVIDFGVLAWTQARMVLHIAAAYDVDAAHPDRATDLLVLQNVHKAAEAARVALGIAAGRHTVGGSLAKAGGAKLAGQLAMKLARMAGVRALKRLFAKVVPGAAVILGTWANRSATKDLAARSMAHFRPGGTGLVPRQVRG